MIVLDASALLAFLFQEPGHERVAAVLSEGAVSGAAMSTVNLAEVVSRFVRDGHAAADILAMLRRTTIEWVPFSDLHALVTAQLQPQGKPFGLSLGDRACLGLALTLGVPVMTSDRVWGRLALDVPVEVIR